MNKNLAKTPPMGWNSWDCYGASVREDEVIGNADYMEKYLKQHGYEYVVVDIQWSEPTAESDMYHAFAKLEMDEFGRLIPAVNRFPSSADGKGFKALSDYVHKKGLKFGIHIMRGIPRQAVAANTPIYGCDKRAKDIADVNSTCPWNTDMYGVDASKEGSQEWYDSIVSMYAEWGVDFIKVDDMSCPYSKGEIEELQKAIEKTGRDIVLSLSPGPTPLEAGAHVIEHANMWRISGDFWDTWSQLYKQFDLLEKWNKFMGQGHFPDADMLPFGRIGIRSAGGARKTNFTKDEQVTLMSLWCIAHSPLMFGGELRDNDEWTLELITNDEVLRVLNHTTCNKQLFRESEKVVWTAKESEDVYYAALFNLSDAAQNVSLSLDKMKLSGKFLVRDLWEHADVCEITSDICFNIAPHACRMIKLQSI